MGTATILLAGIGGCEAPSPAPAVDGIGQPPNRPADGLLADAELQAVVDLQVARDGRGLIRVMRDPAASAAARARAAFAMGSVQDPRAIGALRELMRDPDPAVRRDAAWAMGQIYLRASGMLAIPGAGQDEYLFERIAEEPDPEVRAALFEALGRAVPAVRVSFLMDLAVPPEDRGPRTRAVAHAAAIRDHLPPGITRWFAERLDDPDPEVRAAAAFFFGHYDDELKWTLVRGQVREALDGYDRSDPIAIHLLEGLARVGDPGDAERFQEWLSSSGDWRIRVAAVRGLGSSAARPEAWRALVEALDDENIQVQVAAAEAISGITDLPAARAQEVKAWIEADPGRWRVTGHLVGVVARYDPGFARAWYEARSEPFARALGLKALAAMATPEGIGLVAAAADDPDPVVSGAAIQGLATLAEWRPGLGFTSEAGGAPGPRRIEASRLIGALVASLRREAVSGLETALGMLTEPAMRAVGSADSLVAVYRALPTDAEPARRWSLLPALGWAGGEEAAEILRAEREAADLYTRQAAELGLARLEGRAPSLEPDPLRVDWEHLKALGSRPRLVLETERGTVVLTIEVEEAPLTADKVLRFAEEGLYDGVPFHRVVPGFVAQGGDFTAGDGSGGPARKLVAEFTSIPVGRGILGMANSGKDTEGSQFFIAHSRQVHLDGEYTSFGWVVEGMEVVDRIRLGDRVLRATVEPSAGGG